LIGTEQIEYKKQKFGLMFLRGVRRNGGVEVGVGREERVVVEVVRAVLVGLVALEERGLAYLNIHPANIMKKDENSYCLLNLERVV
jgi:hypothetical protein